MGMIERRRKCRELIRRYYQDVPSREELLDRAISDVLLPDHVLLDAGCGADLPLLTQYGPKVSQAIGVDLCAPSVPLPPRTSVIVGNLETLPLRAASVDVLISRSVLEHLENPVAVFREFSRVLRAKGRLIFTTPNKYYYSCLLARLTPERLKAYYFRTVFGEDAYDNFPVHYRANTVAAFQKLADEAQFKFERVEPIRHYPYYLMFSPLLFRLGIFYDLTITALGLDGLQSNWLVVMERD